MFLCSESWNHSPGKHALGVLFIRSFTDTECTAEHGNDLPQDSRRFQDALDTGGVEAGDLRRLERVVQNEPVSTVSLGDHTQEVVDAQLRAVLLVFAEFSLIVKKNSIHLLSNTTLVVTVIEYDCFHK